MFVLCWREPLCSMFNLPLIALPTTHWFTLSAWQCELQLLQAHSRLASADRGRQRKGRTGFVISKRAAARRPVAADFSPPPASSQRAVQGS